MLANDRRHIGIVGSRPVRATHLRRPDTRPNPKAWTAHRTTALRPGRSRSRPRGPSRRPPGPHLPGVRQPQHSPAPGRPPSPTEDTIPAGSRRGRVRRAQGLRLRHDPGRRRDLTAGELAAVPGVVEPGLMADEATWHRGLLPGLSTLLRGRCRGRCAPGSPGRGPVAVRHEAPCRIPGFNREEFGGRFLGLMAYSIRKR